MAKKITTMTFALIAALIFQSQAHANSFEYSCYQPGDLFKIDLPGSVADLDASDPIRIFKHHNNVNRGYGLIYTMISGDYVFEIYATNFDDNIQPVGIDYRGTGAYPILTSLGHRLEYQIVFKVGQSGSNDVEHNVRILARKREGKRNSIPFALTNPVSIDIRDDLSDCNSFGYATGTLVNP